MTTGELMSGVLGMYVAIAFAVMFVVAFADMLRRHDLTGWAKAGWALALFALPLVGVLIYIIVRPKGARSSEHAPAGSASTAAFPSDRMGPMGPRV